MNVLGSNIFLLAPRLRSISITEIVWGVLAIASTIWSSSRAALLDGGNIFSIVSAVLLCGTGILGVLCIRRLRSNIPDARPFRILGACNAILCTLGSISLVVLLTAIIMLLFWEEAARNLFGMRTLSVDNATLSAADAASRTNQTEPVGELVIDALPAVIYVIYLVITGIYVGITAAAAVYSFRISAGLAANSGVLPTVSHGGESTIPPAGVPLLGGPGYGSYPTASNGGSGYGNYPMASMKPPPVYPPDPPLEHKIAD